MRYTQWGENPKPYTDDPDLAFKGVKELPKMFADNNPEVSAEAARALSQYLPDWMKGKTMPLKDQSTGMTLRQQLAMAAMQGLLSNAAVKGVISGSEIAESAFIQADAMLAYLESEMEVETLKQGTKAMGGK